jgi:hypothetical protein
MAYQYLKDFFNTLLIPNPLKKLIKHQVKIVNLNIKKQIKLQSLVIPKPKHFKSKPFLSEPSTSKPLKFNQKDYLVHFDEHQKKSEEFTQKLWKEKRERKKQKVKRDQRERILRIYEAEQEGRVKEQEKIYRQLKKEEKHRKEQMKIRERQNSLSLIREIHSKEYRKVKSVTPLFKQIEKNYTLNYEIPELEKRKEVLRKKHEMFKPMDHQQIKNHSSKTSQKSSPSSKNPRSPYSDHPIHFTKSRIIDRLLAEDNAKIQAKLEKIRYKQDLMSKQKKYSEIVSEIFTPSADVLKQKELELIKAKLENPVSKRSFLRAFNESPSKNKPQSASARRRPKKNLIEKFVQEKKKIFVKDYIQEMREARKRSFSSKNILNDPESILFDLKKNTRYLKRKIEDLDKEARKEEIKIAYLSPFDSKSLEVTEHVNGLIVNSIRAKIAILDKIS